MNFVNDTSCPYDNLPISDQLSNGKLFVTSRLFQDLKNTNKPEKYDTSVLTLGLGSYRKDID